MYIFQVFLPTLTQISSQSSSGDVAGVGVSLSTDIGRDLPLIVGIESGTPAAEAGLKVTTLPGLHTSRLSLGHAAQGVYLADLVGR